MKHLKLTQLFLLFLLLFTCSLTATADIDNLEGLEKLSNQIKTINWKLDRGKYEKEDLTKWTKITIKLSGGASVCISDRETAIKKLDESLTGLGEKATDESKEVTKQRDKLTAKKTQLEKELAKCTVFKQKSDQASEHINLAEKSYFKEKYLIRGPHILILIKEYVESPFELIMDSGNFLWQHTGFQALDTDERVVNTILVFLAFGLGLWFRKLLKQLERSYAWIDDFSEKILRAIITTSALFVPWLLAATTAAIILYFETKEIEPTPFIKTLSFGLVAFISFIAVIRLLFNPAKPAEPFFDYSPGVATKLSRRFHILALLSLLGYLAFYTVYSESIPELNRLLLRDAFSLAFVLNLIWLFWVLLRSPKLIVYRWLFIGLIVSFAVTVGMEWSGYRNLGLSARRFILALLALFFLFFTVSKMFRDLFNAMDDGTYVWSQRLHERLALEPKQTIPGLIWIRLITTIIVWGLFAYIIIISIDTTGSILEHTRNYIVNGFNIGNFRIVPSQILMSILVFGLILASSGWMRRNMEQNWLPKTSMNKGGREAMVTITGYIMFVVAALAALSVAGFDFSNIAIIAGALSVGIGFGLQNIVNNFVSGLILLFERPIRKGDWVVVGTTEGYVKDIRIRSTRITTFDRSDVIVPNSELISNQVTNWMLEDVRGRAIIKVGVAYGSDTDKVKYILNSVAEENEMVVKDGSSPKPMVLFKGFGESSLDFELRVHLYDVDRRLSTISDINFAIDRAFREEGIEIPFPQRDLHVKSLPEDFSK